MCDSCATDSGCSNPSCAATGCACALSGPKRCATCGHECLPWYFGLDLPRAPVSINNFLGGAGTESPGYDRYPATKAQLLAAARQEISETDEPNPADVAWLDQRLPDGTFRDAGEVFTALWEPPVPPALDGPNWVYRAPVGSIPLGARIQVPPEETALLVGRGNAPLDTFPPGEHPLSRDTAPLAAAQSRAPASGFDRTVLRTSLWYLSTRDQEGTWTFSDRPKGGPPDFVTVRARYALTDPKKFAASKAGLNFSGPLPPEKLLSLLVSPLLRGSPGHDSSSASGDSSVVESTVRSVLDASGFAVRSLSVEHSNVPPLGAFPSGVADRFAHLPPEARAAVQAQMAEAMRRRAAAAGPADAGTRPTPAASSSGPAASMACPSCGAQNPSSGKFCQNCGRPLVTQRSCPACGQAAAPGVKFCGNCGARLG
jgi:Double zinc ribbon